MRGLYAQLAHFPVLDKIHLIADYFLTENQQKIYKLAYVKSTWPNMAKNKNIKGIKVKMEFIGEAIVKPADINDFDDDNPAEFAFIKPEDGSTIVYKEYKKDGFKVTKKIVFSSKSAFYIMKKERIRN